MIHFPLNSLIEKLTEYSKFDADFLAKSADKRMSALSIGSLDEYADYLNDHEQEQLLLREILQINFSFFFRDSLTFELLEHVLIPELIYNLKKKKRNEIRVWSAACAAGQEVYSLSILFEEALAVSQKKWSYRIFGTDINLNQLEKAQKGYYDAEALMNTKLKIIDKWFIKHGATYEINSSLKQNVSFSAFDLNDNQRTCPQDSIFGEFDIILCSNVLFYYNPSVRDSILEKLTQSLSSDGIIITGSAERNLFRKPKYHEAYPYSSIFRYSTTKP